MNKHAMPITIPKEQEPLSYIICLFATLSEKEAKREIVTDENGRVTGIRYRNQNEIVTLNQDYSFLKSVIFDWIEDQANFRPLVLNQEESSIFRELSHAAYYFITEQESISPVEQSFIRFYNTYFKR